MGLALSSRPIVYPLGLMRPLAAGTVSGIFLVLASCVSHAVARSCNADAETRSCPATQEVGSSSECAMTGDLGEMPASIMVQMTGALQADRRKQMISLVAQDAEGNEGT